MEVLKDRRQFEKASGIFSEAVAGGGGKKVKEKKGRGRPSENRILAERVELGPDGHSSK